MFIKKHASTIVGVSLMLFAGCIPRVEPTKQPAKATNEAPVNAATNVPKTSDDGIITSGTGVEKEKPAAGKGNVQGKVLFNSQPAPKIEVKLCKTFNRFFGGCTGETFKATTDDAGEYLIKDVPPGIYEGLIAKVFNSNFYVFATSGYVASAKYKIDADGTFFAPDTSLFKSDLKVLSPKAGAKLDPDKIEVKWSPYPDAAYYKFSVYADTSGTAKPEYDYINKRIDGESFALEKPLTPGAYNVVVQAFNANDAKLAESPNDIKFTVNPAK